MVLSKYSLLNKKFIHMDKKMISVDDLVRQRLSGGEERERAGAWLQMRELLDKEMPQSPGGMLYWRRALSAAALAAPERLRVGSEANTPSNKPISAAIASTNLRSEAEAR